MMIFEAASKSIGAGDNTTPLLDSEECVSEAYWSNAVVALAMGSSTGASLSLKPFVSFEIMSESIEKIEFGVDHANFEITAIAIQDANPILPEPLTFYWG